MGVGWDLDGSGRAGRGGRRWLLFAVGLAASAAITVLLWWAGLPGFALLLLFPFFFLGRKSLTAAAPVRACQACGYTAADPEVRFCPRDGQMLR